MNAIKIFSASGDISSIAIAIIGAIISVAAALYLSSRKINADFRLRRIELTNIYAENILKKRFEIYPEAWLLLSDYVKLSRDYFKNGNIKRIADVESLRRLYDNYSDWDSRNSMVLSNNAARVSGRFRRGIYLMLEGLADRNGSDKLTEDEKTKVKDLLQQIEVALRIDIGINEVDDFEQKMIIESYKELKKQETRKK